MICFSDNIILSIFIIIIYFFFNKLNSTIIASPKTDAKLFPKQIIKRQVEENNKLGSKKMNKYQPKMINIPLRKI